jgi:enoyl-CoA hydratase/carnithine racemase
MSGSPLIVTRDGDLTRLTLNRPECGNNLSSELVLALTQAVEAASGDGTRLMVIDSTGKHFCTGFDLSTLATETDDTLLARFVRIELLLQQIHSAPFATVAIARGRAIGAGADLFAACEQRWIAGSASFAFPGAGFGLVLGSGRLADLVGSSRARGWISEGGTVDGALALESGLATARMEADQVEPGLRAATMVAARLAPITQRDMRRATLARGADGLAHDLRALVVSAAHSGIKERIEAYRRNLAAPPSAASLSSTNIDRRHQ